MVATLGTLFWQNLQPDQQTFLLNILQNNVSYIFSIAVLFLAAFGFALDWFFRFYIIPISQLADEAALVGTINPSLQIQISGSRDVERLVEAINQNTQLFHALKNSVQKQIELANAETENEKNILATFMSELPEGVLICNHHGQILLYNRRAKQIFGKDIQFDNKEAQKPDDVSRFVGLGRSVFSLIDKNLLMHALDETIAKLKRLEKQAVSHFVVTGNNNELLRTEAVPIFHREEQFGGFILLFHDITRQIENETRINAQVQLLIRELRGALAGIHAAAGLLADYPEEMDSQRQSSLIGIIRNEARRINRLIEKTSAEGVGRLKTRWPLAPMMAMDLLDNIKRKAAERLAVTLNITTIEADTRLKVDSYSFSLAVLFVINQLIKHLNHREIACRVKTDGKFVLLDLCWQGPTLKMETVKRWDEMQLSIQGEGGPFTLNDIMGYHDAELYLFTEQRTTESAYIRFFLPAFEADDEPVHHVRNLTILPDDRPEFYNFDLFNQPGQTPILDQRLLTELAYTAFDTETTGLDPRGGDEIISIGAIRIVNGRLLHDEVFEQLIDPQRDLPHESIKIHKITPEDLKGQPTIERVLPAFHQYVEDTILVGHNVAFDMRMLQMKEALSGVRFINPVLDTMHLSAVVHPAHTQHGIEPIAARLGVKVIGRHSAMGDAITTAEIFVRLIPLLNEMGIRTLKEARSASQRTYYARLKY